MTIPKAPRAVPLLMLAAGLVVAIDQIAKAIVRAELSVCSAPPVRLCDRVDLPGPFGILWTVNGDGAFGLLDASFIGPVVIVAIAALAWRIARHSTSTWLLIGFGLQIGGVLANLLDRAWFGAVTDFIDIRVGGADNGLVLNPADIGLALGGVLVAILLGRKTGHQEPGARLVSPPRIAQA